MTRLISILLLGVLVAASPAPGQPPETALREKVQGSVEIRQDTQEKEDTWHREELTLISRYRSANSRIRTLEEQVDQSQEKARLLKERIRELSRRLEESERLEAGLQEVMDATLGRLERWVQQDLPFLPEERAARLRSLKEALTPGDTLPAGKLRRLLEALQVECEYGDSVEVYQQEIQVDGESVFADILRLGRLSIFWQTPDGKRVGEYDRAADRWVELPPRYRKGIQMATEMANKTRPVELTRLPLGRISP